PRVRRAGVADVLLDAQVGALRQLAPEPGVTVVLGAVVDDDDAPGRDAVGDDRRQLVERPAGPPGRRGRRGRWPVELRRHLPPPQVNPARPVYSRPARASTPAPGAARRPSGAPRGRPISTTLGPWPRRPRTRPSRSPGSGPTSPRRSSGTPTT